MEKSLSTFRRGGKSREFYTVLPQAKAYGKTVQNYKDQLGIFESKSRIKLPIDDKAVIIKLIVKPSFCLSIKNYLLLESKIYSHHVTKMI